MAHNLRKHYHVYMAELAEDGKPPNMLMQPWDIERHRKRTFPSRTAANNFARMKKLDHWYAVVKVCNQAKCVE